MTGSLSLSLFHVYYKRNPITGLKHLNQGCRRISFLKCLYKSDNSDDLISQLWDHVDGATDLHHWICNHKLNSFRKGINCNNRSLGKKNKGFLGSFLPVHTQWALLVSLKWTEAAEVSFHSATNVSWLQRRECKSALTGLLRWLCVHSNARRICLPRHPHGNKARTAGLGQSGRCKGDSPGQVFLCSLSLWLLHSFFVFLREKARESEREVTEGWRNMLPALRSWVLIKHVQLIMNYGRHWPEWESSLQGVRGLLKTKRTLLSLHTCTLEVSHFSPATAANIYTGLTGIVGVLT